MMDLAVIDASAVVALLVEEQAVGRLQLLVGDADVIAPHHLDLEVLSALRRHEAIGALDRAAAADAVAALDAAPIDRVATRHLTTTIWELRHNLTPYDASYVALAHHEGCPLISHDGRLARAPGVDVPVLRLGGGH